MKLFSIFICTLLFGATGRAQKNPAVEMYISQFAPLAMEEQQRTGMPAAIKLAQAIHESGAGNGDLAQRSNNHFGLKCKSNWTGKTAFHDDDEKGECFRAYDSISQSYRDQSDFLKNNKRYASLFTLDVTDYKGWANGLKQAGYATNPAYTQKLIQLIETYELFVFSEKAKENATVNVPKAIMPATLSSQPH
jgi:flagellum-specific peptidoglycan hydrolase FlgJ